MNYLRKKTTEKREKEWSQKPLDKKIVLHQNKFTGLRKYS